MYEIIEGVALLIALITFLISYRGLKDSVFFEKYVFEVDPILINREYVRLLSSGFLHSGWMHLLFNMLALYTFSYGVSMVFGVKDFLLIYFVSMLSGNLLSLYFHRQHGDYRAVGASGGVSGVIFASIVLFPSQDLVFWNLLIPSWAFGIGYILISIYGIRAQNSNIGHDAHLGGAITGVLISVMLRPSILKVYPELIAALLLPFIVFMILVAKKPHLLLIPLHSDQKQQPKKTSRLSDEEMLNYLLDKVNSKGFKSLSAKEKNILEDLSRKIES